MSAPAEKAPALINEVGDQSTPLSDFRLRWLYSELRSLLPCPDTRQSAEIYSAMGSALRRRGKFSEALEHQQKAHMLDRKQGMYLNNIAVSLLDLDRPTEALDKLVLVIEEAPKDDGRVMLYAYANVAEAFARLGQPDAAKSAFEAAMGYADRDNREHLFILAQQAATIGARTAALEFAARFVALATGVAIGEKRALDVVRSAPPHVRASLQSSAPLWPILELFLDPPIAEEVADEGTADALEVFEATIPWRANATSEVLAR